MKHPSKRFAWKLLIVVMLTCLSGAVWAADPIDAGFAEVDITPSLDRPVWLAGYTPGRRATAIHDPLFARCVVFKHQQDRVALVSVDLVGLQMHIVQRVRKSLKGFKYVMVSSTHNHEGPDVIGLWGKSFFQKGTDEKYMKQLVDRIVSCVKEANGKLKPVVASFGTAQDETLLRDSRKPVAKDGVLRAIRFDNQVTAESGQRGKPAGIVVQWNCHPEALGAHNKQVTADFPYATVGELKKRYGCPVVYFSGTVGGLMAPPRDRVRDETGKVLRDGTFKYAELYGKQVANLANQAIDTAKPANMTPIQVATQAIALPVTNSWYRAARALGIVRRPGYVWTGDYRKIGALITPANANQATAIVSEVGYLRMGDLRMLCVPGEIYPELVYGTFQDPAEKAADFPEASLEPHLTDLLPSDKWMLFGLANDEIGYIIPKRQWDIRPPYAYGRRTGQYGEINSCGPDVAPIVMDAFRRLIKSLVE